MNLNHLAIFVAVAEEGSVVKGAERLMVSQPAVSKQIKEFESALGVKLFDRLPGGVKLTDAGEKLLPHARRLFAIEAEAARALEELRGVRGGRLRIGASMTTGVYLLPQYLARFRQRYPKVELQVEINNTDNIQHLLLDHSVDLAFTEGFVEHAELIATAFATDELVPIVRPGHELLKQKHVTLTRFLAEPFILREVGSGTRAVVEHALAQHGARVSPILSLANTEAIKRCVAAGLGVAIVSRLAVETELASGALVQVGIRGLVIRRPLHLVELRGRQRSAAAEAFLAPLVG